MTMRSSDLPPRPDRRTAIKWMLTAAASGTLLGQMDLTTPDAARPVTGPGYGTDPDLVKSYRPGDVWPLTFSAAQRAATAALCALIIPAESSSKSAADVGVQDFIDEWISAPYPAQARDRPQIIALLEWIDAEAQRRHGQIFVDLRIAQKARMCDAICSVQKAAPEHKQAAQNFVRFRYLTVGGFYTSPEGMKDIGYTGNVPTATFDGPSPEVLKKLGLT